RGAWAVLPPSVRRWTLRGLVGAGLFVTLKERTLPALGDEVALSIERIAKAPLEAIGEKLRSAVGALLGMSPEAIGPAAAVGLYAVVLAFFGGFAWLTRPRPFALATG
ncbi:MAG TPA: hypothetical protein VNC50_08910, partial [Planctomycetia bacterium]|nr:hypothetical protein [Planctomycetia bacterium]